SLAAATRTARISSVSLGSSRRCLRTVRIEKPARFKSRTCSEWRWRSRMNSGDEKDPSRPRRRRSRHTHGIHSDHRPAIALSRHGGRVSRKELGLLGSKARKTGKELALMVPLQLGKAPQPFGIRPRPMLLTPFVAYDGAHAASQLVRSPLLRPAENPAQVSNARSCRHRL